MKQTLDLRRIGLFLLFAFGIAWAVALWIYLTNLAKGWPAWLAAWLAPIVLCLLGAALYFLAFPGQADLSLPI